MNEKTKLMGYIVVTTFLLLMLLMVTIVSAGQADKARDGNAAEKQKCSLQDYKGHAQGTGIACR